MPKEQSDLTSLLCITNLVTAVTLGIELALSLTSEDPSLDQKATVQTAIQAAVHSSSGILIPDGPIANIYDLATMAVLKSLDSTLTKPTAQENSI